MMKKLAMALVLILLLAGCGEVPETTPTTLPAPVTEPTLPPETCYSADSVMERVTDGAVKQYNMNAQIHGFTLMGENLLVYTEDQNLSLLGGETMQVLSRRRIERANLWTSMGVVTAPDRMAYYDEETGSYVILTGTLGLQSEVKINGNLTAGPVMSSDFVTVYYAEATSIRAMDLGTGLSRLLRQENAEIVSVDGVFFNDTVLRYTRRLADGTLQTCFVDAGNGASFHTADFQGKLVSWEDSYAGVLTSGHPLGQSHLVVCGDLNGKMQILETEQLWEEALFPGNGLVIMQQIDKLGLHLTCYDLETGEMISAVNMSHRDQFFTMGCADGSKIWLCDGASDKFFCWDTDMTRVEMSDSWLGEYHSLGDPDTAGMEACYAWAEQLEERFGVVITFREENNRTAGVDYAGYLDYQPRMYAAALEMLQTALERLPEWLPKRMAQCTEKDKLEIILVDDYDPAREYAGGEGDMSMDNGQATVWVSMSEDLDRIFYHQLFHVAEVRIQNTRDGFSDWEDMNPKGFIYATQEAYEAGLLKDSEYLTFGSNYFADDHGMVGPREDRAQIFVYAVLEDQQERFASDAMQIKLERICSLLRKAYWADKGEELIWEQYLLSGE